jgi:hypothetical protein
MFLKITITALCAVLTLLLVAASAAAVIILSAAGVLSVFVALGCIVGILRNVASDLAPQAMLCAGFFGVFSALSIASALFILCPKIIARFNAAAEQIFS